MVLFPNCKINLGLNILRKRTDGYHDLETIFYPVGWKDAIEVVQAAGNEPSAVHLSTSGLPVDGEPTDNLCVKAYHLLKKDFPELPPVQIHLHKTIPMGAGLGGGSADGAFTLKLLNEKFGLAISNEELMAYALQLGSDCPFFLLNKPCFASGRGEQMEEIMLDLSAYKLVLIHPPVHISTAWAFSQLEPTQPGTSLKEMIRQPVRDWKLLLKNDFEAPVLQRHPEIGRIKTSLYRDGAIYASMTGSGSTVFGIFEKNRSLSVSFDPGYHIKEVISTN